MRTAMCSAMRPPPGHGYSTGMSQPPKLTIFALRARCVALSVVFLRGVATEETRSDMADPQRSGGFTSFNIGTAGGGGQLEVRRAGARAVLARGND